MEEREKADVINDFGRDPIGEGKEEQVCRIASVAFMTDRTQRYNRELKDILDDSRDDVPPVPEMGERPPGAAPSGKGKRSRVKLEDLTRFTMVKRIW